MTKLETLFNADQNITDVIAQNSFTVSAEIIPPRNGAEMSIILNQISDLRQAGAEFFSVTKGAGGSLRGGSLPVAQVIKEQFKVPVIAHFTCRDLLPEEVENQLIDHHYFGIRNILALRGDPPVDQPSLAVRDGSYTYAYELIDQIQKLNSGQFISRRNDSAYAVNGTNRSVSQNVTSIRPGLQTAVRTDFSIGCAVYPEHPNEAERFEFFEKKVEAGATYAISQMIFDVDAFCRFRDEAMFRIRKRFGREISILPGTRMVRTRKQAQRMSERFLVSVPQKFLQELPESESEGTLDRSLDVFSGMFETLKSRGIPGIHLFVLNDTPGSVQLIRRIKYAGVAK